MQAQPHAASPFLVFFSSGNPDSKMKSLDLVVVISFYPLIWTFHIEYLKYILALSVTLSNQRQLDLIYTNALIF